jgi:two-component system, NarL family, invasion response regulator UvrY
MEIRKYKVVLVDDHSLLREALSSLIAGFDDFQVVGSLNNGHELIRALSEGLRPDLILLDLNMPVLDGFDTAKWLQINHPDIKLLVLTMYDSEIALIRLLQTGVRGFLKKDTHPNELNNALKSVCNNGFYYSHDTTGKLASMFQKNPENQRFIDKAILTENELEFLRLASTDMTYKEIAAKLSISPRVIDSYRDALFEKLDVKSRVGLAIYAVKNGIVCF